MKLIFNIIELSKMKRRKIGAKMIQVLVFRLHYCSLGFKFEVV